MENKKKRYCVEGKVIGRAHTNVFAHTEKEAIELAKKLNQRDYVLTDWEITSITVEDVGE